MEEKKTITVQVNTKLLKQATKKLEEKGLDIDTVIHWFLYDVIDHNGLPFEIENEEN